MSSREFTDELKKYCQQQIENSSLDEVGFAVLLNELGKIEKDRSSTLSGINKNGDSFFMHVLKQHSDKITERIDKFTVK